MKTTAMKTMQAIAQQGQAMKKMMILAAAAVFTLSASAQQFTEKKGDGRKVQVVVVKKDGQRILFDQQGKQMQRKQFDKRCKMKGKAMKRAKKVDMRRKDLGRQERQIVIIR